MADEEEVGAPENTATKVWTTGDPAVDWARYEGQFDRVDAEVRHRFVCLPALDAIVVCGVIGGRGMNVDVGMALTALFMWLGFAVSLMIYWSQYRARCYRRDLCKVWPSLYPEVSPAPYGYQDFVDGSPSVAPSAMVALLSSMSWLFILIIMLLPSGLYLLTDFLNWIRCGAFFASLVALAVFYVVFAKFYASRHSSTEPPRKW